MQACSCDTTYSPKVSGPFGIQHFLSAVPSAWRPSCHSRQDHHNLCDTAVDNVSAPPNPLRSVLIFSVPPSSQLLKIFWKRVSLSSLCSKAGRIASAQEVVHPGVTINQWLMALECKSHSSPHQAGASLRHSLHYSIPLCDQPKSLSLCFQNLPEVHIHLPLSKTVSSLRVQKTPLISE